MDLKTGFGNNNRHLIDAEQGTLQKLETKIKNNVFGVLFVLLKDHEISIYFCFILAIIQFLQIIVFPFHPTIAAVWAAEDITDVLYDIFGYFDIVTYIKKANWSIYVTLLYIGLALIVLVLFAITFVSFIFNQRKASFGWAVLGLKYILLFFGTILFMPFVEYFVSFVACADDGSKKVHSYFTEIECWKGEHIIHAVFSLLFCVIFLVISLTVSITFFEYKISSNDPSARVTSRPHLIVNIYQGIMIIALTFLTGEQFQVILLGMILLGSVIIFIKFYFQPPYHDEIMAKLWASIAAVNLWSAVMVVFSRIMENTLFEGSVIAWLLGFPFIILVILTNRDHRIDLLLINVNKFQSGSEIQSQIRYILKLMNWQGSKRNAGILLDGYIEIHKQSCTKEDCPLKQKVIKNHRFTKSLLNNNEGMDEKYAVLIQLCYQMYFDGIKKFPNDNALRISYAFFLLENMHSKQQALQELTQTEQNKPFFDEQFIIYRYKKLLEDEIAESQNQGQGGLDAVSEVAFQNQFRQLQASIEKSSLLHMEFWSQLSEDNPDLAKLSDSGSKINISVQYVEDNWNKLIKINPHNTKAMRIYGKYLIEIINDKEAGDQLLEKARTISNIQLNKRALNILSAGSEDSGNESTPTIWVSGEQEKFGIITGINLAAASMFGYNKTELLNRKVNMLMPQVFAKHHDTFLENYLNTGEGALVGKNKERLIFGKNKSNYAFPTYLSIKAAQSIIQGIQFIATFRTERNFKSSAYVITTPEGIIDAISSSCINILKIDNRVLSSKKVNIQDYVPSLIANRSQIFSTANSAGRSSAVISFSYPKDSEYVMENEERQAQLSCHLYELLFMGGKENAGFYFKFERVMEKGASANVDKRAKISNFQFKFDKQKALILGEYVEGSSADLQTNPEDDENLLNGLMKSAADPDNSAIEGNNGKLSGVLKSQADEEEEIKYFNYGAGIKTLRLLNGKPQEIEEDNSDSEKSDENSSNKSQGQQKEGKENPKEEENVEDESYKDFNSSLKSRKAFNAILSDRTPPSTVRNLKYVVHGLSLLLLVIAIIDYVIANTEFNGMEKKFTLLDTSNQQISELMETVSKVRDLRLLLNGVEAFFDDIDETYFREALMTSLNTAKQIKETLEQDTSGLSSEHLNLLNNPTIELLGVGGTTETKSLIGAIENIISRGYEIQARAGGPTEVADANYYYIVYNMLNNVYAALLKNSEYYSMELDAKVNAKNNTLFLLLFLASILALALSVLLIVPIFYKINRSRLEILSLFLDIPEKTVKGLYNKCETFISNLQVGEEDEMLSEVDEDDLGKQNGENSSQEFITRKKRKRFKNSAKGHKSFIIQFIGMSLLIEAYFAYNFGSSFALLSDISTLSVEFNSTSSAEPFYAFANNAERQLFIDNSFPILGQDAQDVVTGNIKAMYDLDSLYLQQHSINRKIHTQEYSDMFNQIMMVDPCQTIGEVVNQTECEIFADLTVSQGMTVAYTRQFETLRTLLSCYSSILDGDTCTITLPTPIIDVNDADALQDETINLMRTKEAKEVSRMQSVYIKRSMRLLLETFGSSITNKFDSALTTRLILFIIFICVIGALYLIMWLPLIANVNNEIWRTKAMLSMIPLNVVAKIRSIRIYLKRFWNERSATDY